MLLDISLNSSYCFLTVIVLAFTFCKFQAISVHLFYFIFLYITLALPFAVLSLIKIKSIKHSLIISVELYFHKSYYLWCDVSVMLSNIIVKYSAPLLKVIILLQKWSSKKLISHSVLYVRDIIEYCNILSGKN